MPKAKKTNDFELPPKGQKAAICISSIDLGTHSSEYKGKIKERRIVRLIWAFIEADKTYTVSRISLYQIHLNQPFEKLLKFG